MQSLTVNKPSVNAIVISQGTERIMTLWLDGKSKQTVRAYRSDVYEFLTFVEGKELAQIALDDLVRYRSTLEGMDKSTATVNRKLLAIKSLLSFCKSVGLNNFNPGKMVKTKSDKDRLAQRILSQEQVRELIGAISKERDQTIVKFLYLTGCRVSELTALNWSDIIPNDGKDGAKVVIYGKGGKTRIALISQEMLENLGERGLPDSPVFLSKSGKRLDQSIIFRIVNKAGKLIGIDNVSPHWLRHCNASHSLQNGADINLVKTSLGHHSLAVTERYLHNDPTDFSGNYLKV